MLILILLACFESTCESSFGYDAGYSLGCGHASSGHDPIGNEDAGGEYANGYFDGYADCEEFYED